MTVFAYIRVSTDDQTTENQKLQISKQGFAVDEWFSENGVSGTVKAINRPVFTEMLDKALAGDTICVLTLDRLGRNTEDILSTIRVCQERNIKLRVMALDGTDMTSKSGKILTVLMSLIAELERDDISARTKAGLARTREEGTVLGRPMKMSYDKLVACIAKREEGWTLNQISKEFSVDRNTVLQTMNKWKAHLEVYKVRWEKQCAQAEAKEKTEE